MIFIFYFIFVEVSIRTIDRLITSFYVNETELKCENTLQNKLTLIISDVLN